MTRLLKAAVALLCLGLTSLSHGQLTTITASKLKMGGVLISAGKVTFTPVALNGQPIALVEGNGGGSDGPQAFLCTITDGAITGTCQIPASSLTQPPDLL